MVRVEAQTTPERFSPPLLGENLLKPREAMKEFGVSNKTIREWTDNGLLPVVRTLGGQRRIPRSAIELIKGNLEPLEQEDPLLTTGEVAKEFKVERATVRRWIDNGLIPSIRTLGGHRRVPESALEKFEQPGKKEKLLTNKKARERLKVSSRTLRRLINKGDIRSIRTPGGQRRIPESALAELATLPNDQKVATTSEAAVHFGVSIPTIRAWCDEGRLECIVTHGGHRRIILEPVIGAEIKDISGVIYRKSD